MALKAFVFAVNLQVLGREQQHSAVFYYATEDPTPPGSLFYRFVYGDDAFRNSRFKLLNQIVKGPWIVRATVGNHTACLLGKALTCRYLKGENYLEINVDIGSSALASAVVHLALGCVTSVSVDMAFMVESQSEEELPERLIGAIRIQQIEMSSALYADPADKNLGGGGFKRHKLSRGLRGHGSGKVEDEGVGYSNTAHRLTIFACKVGGLRAADPTHLKFIRPNLGRSGSDLPYLRAIHCRSWLDLPVWNKIQDHTTPRQQIGRYRQRLRRGRTVFDMQKNHCSFGSDPYDLVHIRAQSQCSRISLLSTVQS